MAEKKKETKKETKSTTYKPIAYTLTKDDAEIKRNNLDADSIKSYEDRGWKVVEDK